LIAVQTPVLTPQSKVSVQDIAKGQSARLGIVGHRPHHAAYPESGGGDRFSQDVVELIDLFRPAMEGQAMLPISEWRSQPIARIGCCEPPQPTILAIQAKAIREGRLLHFAPHFAGIGCCVSRNYPDRKWRIVCDPRPFEERPTFRTRTEAAVAEWLLTQAETLGEQVSAE
jgi:hypothetical protein